MGWSLEYVFWSLCCGALANIYLINPIWPGTYRASRHGPIQAGWRGGEGFVSVWPISEHGCLVLLTNCRLVIDTEWHGPVRIHGLGLYLLISLSKKGVASIR